VKSALCILFGLSALTCIICAIGQQTDAGPFHYCGGEVYDAETEECCGLYGGAGTEDHRVVVAKGRCCNKQPLEENEDCCLNPQNEASFPYDRETMCCTGGFDTAPKAVQKYPIQNLGDCPHRVEHCGYDPGPGNGCGAEGGVWVPDGLPWIVDFRNSCNDHDQCWGTCNADERGCSDTFRSDLRRDCETQVPKDAPALVAVCKLAAEGYYLGVNSSAGHNAYEAAQKVACDCCGEDCDGDN
jgi:Group XII secretory phospholipase A2 precursor (PLA2G12)